MTNEIDPNKPIPFIQYLQARTNNEFLNILKIRNIHIDEHYKIILEKTAKYIKNNNTKLYKKEITPEQFKFELNKYFEINIQSLLNMLTYFNDAESNEKDEIENIMNIKINNSIEHFANSYNFYYNKK